ncbi:hypothetical protein [Canibacter zhoujuaniae]|uniref:hypothetical protein n=1 Tax=Canibacter zhoujuaniae TaxID=2708343 RepID=UPI001421B51E|nr:hypothetical protein [Canibacter zhoujuaniae]
MIVGEFFTVAAAIVTFFGVLVTAAFTYLQHQQGRLFERIERLEERNNELERNNDELERDVRALWLYNSDLLNACLKHNIEPPLPSPRVQRLFNTQREIDER